MTIGLNSDTILEILIFENNTFMLHPDANVYVNEIKMTPEALRRCAERVGAVWLNPADSPRVIATIMDPHVDPIFQERQSLYSNAKINNISTSDNNRMHRLALLIPNLSGVPMFLAVEISGRIYKAWCNVEAENRSPGGRYDLWQSEAADQNLEAVTQWVNDTSDGPDSFSSHAPQILQEVFSMERLNLRDPHAQNAIAAVRAYFMGTELDPDTLE